MNKLSAGKASILALTAVLMVAAFLLGKSLTTAFAQVEKITWCHCEPNGGCQTLNLPGSALQNAGHMDASGNPLHAGDHADECTSEIVDLCTNIEGNQESVPEDYYHTEEGTCEPKTPVCTDESFENYGGQNGIFDEETEIANDELCSNEPAVDVCPNLEGDQETLPEGYDYDEQRNCVQIESSPTPEPTPLSCSGDTHLDASGKNCVPYSFGGPGAGGTGGQVLGATTMAQTGSFLENIYAAIMAFGATLTTKGLKNLKKAFKKA
jgi:hypothetical protein